jgi:diguanylate cyclase (GGDEF)-like protein
VRSNNASTTEFLKVSGFQSIKTKILIFALLATVIPSLILGVLSYLQNSKMLKAKITNTMLSATVQAGGKLDLWLKERMYDLRVFASSYVITENAARLRAEMGSKNKAVMPLNLIQEYLHSVSGKFAVYNELILLDATGTPLTTGSPNGSEHALPKQWAERLADRRPIIPESHFDTQTGLNDLLMAEPIKGPDGLTLGYLAAKINLETIGSMLRSHCTSGIDEMYLVDTSKRLVISSRPAPLQLQSRNRTVHVPESRHAPTNMPASYTGFRDRYVVGMATSIPVLNWVLVAEIEHRNAYAELVLLRRITTALVVGLILCIGSLAYLFGHNLVRPVRRLSAEAARVAGGNLDVDLPVTGQSEVSYLTQVFNHMVFRLRQGREKLSAANQALLESNKELHQLSITDGLTGLFNRKHIMELLEREISRSRRYGCPITVLMLDIDHFKQVNDSYGHQAGDAVMCRLSAVLRGMVRDVDFVGRYGGEEFLVLLPDSDCQSGAETAERIRRKVQDLEIIANHQKISVTLSIGVSSHPQMGRDSDALICMADEALYQAKSTGRNRIVISNRHTCSESAVVHVLADHQQAARRRSQSS